MTATDVSRHPRVPDAACAVFLPVAPSFARKLAAPAPAEGPAPEPDSDSDSDVISADGRRYSDLSASAVPPPPPAPAPAPSPLSRDRYVRRAAPPRAATDASFLPQSIDRLSSADPRDLDPRRTSRLSAAELPSAPAPSRARRGSVVAQRTGSLASPSPQGDTISQHSPRSHRSLIAARRARQSNQDTRHVSFGTLTDDAHSPSHSSLSLSFSARLGLGRAPSSSAASAAATPSHVSSGPVTPPAKQSRKVSSMSWKNFFGAARAERREREKANGATRLGALQSKLDKVNMLDDPEVGSLSSSLLQPAESSPHVVEYVTPTRAESNASDLVRGASRPPDKPREDSRRRMRMRGSDLHVESGRLVTEPSFADILDPDRSYEKGRRGRRGRRGSHRSSLDPIRWAALVCQPRNSGRHAPSPPPSYAFDPPPPSATSYGARRSYATTAVGGSSVFDYSYDRSSTAGSAVPGELLPSPASRPVTYDMSRQPYDTSRPNPNDVFGGFRPEPSSFAGFRSRPWYSPTGADPYVDSSVSASSSEWDDDPRSSKQLRSQVSVQRIK